MSTVCFTGAELFLDGVARHTEANQFALSYKAADLDATTFGDKGAVSRKGGLKDAALSLGGLMDVTAADFAEIGGSDAIFVGVPAPTGAGDTMAEGDIAYIAQSFQGSLAWGGSVGDLLGFDITLLGTGQQPIARGPVLSITAGAVTAEVQPVTAVPMGAGAVGWVVAVVAITDGGSGGDITVTVDSDDGAGFGTSTSRHAPGLVSTAGDEHSSLTDLGVISGETHWRATVTTTAAVTSLIVALGCYIPVA